MFICLPCPYLIFIDRTSWLLTHPTDIKPIFTSVYIYIWWGTIVNLFNSSGFLNSRQANSTGESSRGHISTGQRSNVQTSSQINSTGQSSRGHVSTGQRSIVQMLLAKDLEIMQDQENIYQRCVLQRDSRFMEALEALHVKVLRIRAKINLGQLLPNAIYLAYLIFKTKPNSRGLDISQEATVYVDGNPTPKKVCLDPTEMTPHDIGLPEEMRDGWMEVELGRFFHDPNGVGEVVVCLQETNVDNEKTGLIVAAIEVRAS